MPYTNERGTTVDHQRQATAEMAAQFYRLFVNRRAYTLQSMRPHPETGRPICSLTHTLSGLPSSTSAIAPSRNG